MRRAALLCLAAALVFGTAGCATVRNGLQAKVGVCFSALPPARSEVGPSARLAGVGYVSARSLERGIARHYGGRPPVLPPALARYEKRALCLVGFRGTVSPKATKGAWRPEPGRVDFTIVAVRHSDDEVLAVIVLPRSLTGFGGLI